MADAADRIRRAVAQVNQIREHSTTHPDTGAALRQVKALQGARFSATYQDLLASPVYRKAALFFLEELYGDRDFRERDDQFGRIAGALERLFPQAVVDTALVLAQLHALTEELDHAMALAWPFSIDRDSARYIHAWRNVGHRDQRLRQLESVQKIGRDLVRLTRTPGLRQLLRLMRTPARAAGLGALQLFLERGFDTFAELASVNGHAESFLDLIHEREHTLIHQFFDCDPKSAEPLLEALLSPSKRL